VDIEDNTGTEELESINEFAPARFYDGTRRIRLEFRGYHPGLLTIQVVFHTRRDDSTIRISRESDAAREFVIGMVDGLERAMAASRTLHGWLNPPFWIGVVLAGIVRVLAAMVFNQKTPHRVLVTLLVVNISLLGFWILGKLKPYSTFDTRHNDRLQRASNWFLVALVGFLIFTVVGGYFRLRWLGF